jgi:hypothetical protein
MRLGEAGKLPSSIEQRREYGGLARDVGQHRSIYRVNHSSLRAVGDDCLGRRRAARNAPREKTVSVVVKQRQSEMRQG